MSGQFSILETDTWQHAFNDQQLQKDSGTPVPVRAGCKSLCDKHYVKMPQGGNGLMYSTGHKYCKKCEFWTKTGDKFCKCCGRQFRVRSKAGRPEGERTYIE